MNKNRLLISILFILSISIFANENKDDKKKSFSVAYFGEFITHPGLKLSLEMPFYSNNGNECFATLEGGGYFHYLNHTAFFIGSEFGYRHTFKNGIDFHALIGIGYFHKFLGGTIYEVSDSGELFEVTNYGSPHFMPNLGIGFGYTFARHSENPVSIYSRTEIFGEYPYNSYILPHLVTSIGVRINI